MTIKRRPRLVAGNECVFKVGCDIIKRRLYRWEKTMKIGGRKLKLKSNSALAIAAGCAVAFMFIATIISVALYRQRMNEAARLLQEAKYTQYDSYVVMISSDDESDFWQEVYRSASEYGKEHGVYVDRY